MLISLPTGAVGHYTVSRDHDVTDQECRLSFPDHLPRPRQDGGRKWAGDETTVAEEPAEGTAVFAWKLSFEMEIWTRSNDVIRFAWQRMLLRVFSLIFRYTLTACASFLEGTVSRES